MGVIFCNLRSAPPVHLQALVKIREWQVAQCPDGRSVLAGVVASRPTVLTIRVTTPIVSVDPDLRIVQTRSSRLYELTGGPARRDSVLNLIACRLAISGYAETQDITSEVWRAFRNAPLAQGPN